MQTIQRRLETLKLQYIRKKYLNNNPRVQEILRCSKNSHPEVRLLDEDVSGLPGNPEFVENGWSKNMLLRYALAMHYSKEKKVLDSCSGLGWGAYLLDDICDELACIEIDNEAIKAAKKLWPYQRARIIKGSVFNMPFTDQSFDVVTAMESIEHFTVKDTRKYFIEINRVLKFGGRLIGSSYFPDTEEEAEKVCSRNKRHLHIYTKYELKELLKVRGFEKIRVFGNRLFFIAQEQTR